MEKGFFEPEHAVVCSYLAPHLVECCCPKGMERDALLLRMNWEVPEGIRYVLHCDTWQPCKDKHGDNRKHFILRETEE